MYQTVLPESTVYAYRKGLYNDPHLPAGFMFVNNGEILLAGRQDRREVPKKSGHVLCLIPETHGVFTDRIFTWANEDNYRTQFLSRSFPAHITIARYNFDFQSLLEIAWKLVENHPPFEATLAPLTGQEGRYFRAVYAPIPVIPESPLNALLEHAKSLIGPEQWPDTELHLSMLYGYLTREDMSQFIVTHVIPEELRHMKISQIGIMDAEAEPDSWRMIQTFLLRGDPSVGRSRGIMPN